MKNHHSSSVLIGDHAVWVFQRHSYRDALRQRRSDLEKIAASARALWCSPMSLVLLQRKRSGSGWWEATPNGYNETGRFSIPQESLPTWSHPVVAGGRLYLRDQDSLYAF